MVELSDGRRGVVLESKERDLVRPRVLLVTGEESEKDAIPAVIDLKTTANVFIRQVYDDYGKMTVPPLREKGVQAFCSVNTTHLVQWDKKFMLGRKRTRKKNTPYLLDETRGGAL